MADPPSSRRRNRPRDRADPILDAVVLLLVESGFKQLTMDAVASRARVSKQTIYRLWSSQAELVIAAVRSLAAPEPDMDHTKGPFMDDTGTLAGDLNALLHSIGTELTNGEFLSIVALLALSRRSDQDLDAALTDLSVERRRPYCQAASRAVKRGELPGGGRCSDRQRGRAVFLRHLLRRVKVAEGDLEEIVSTVLEGVCSSVAERPAFG